MPGSAPRGVTAASVESLVGRGALTAELEAACRDAAAGTGSVFLFEGEAGIGKTSVARWVAATAEDQGFEVTWGRCSPDSGAPPLWPWIQLVGDELGLIGAHADRSRVDAVGAARFELLRTLAGHIARTRSDRPALHVVEDLQWADVASVLLIGHVAAELDRSRLLVVATLRTGEPLGNAIDDALEEARHAVRVRELQPLDRAGVEAMIRSTGIPPGPDLTTLVLTRTGGNPLFVTELVRTVGSLPATESPLERLAGDVPGPVAELVRRRAARLPPAVADLVASAAVLGVEGDIRVLADVHGLDVEQVLELMEQARAARLLSPANRGRWQFRHALVRDAIYESLTSAQRPERHARALDALTNEPDTQPAELAAHGLAALPLLDPDRAVALAARAGETAFDRMGYEEAVGWFEEALRVAPMSTSPRWRAELLLLSGDAHRQMGETRKAEHAFRAAAELVDEPALVARAALGYANPGADLGIAFRLDDPEAARLLERACSLQPAGDSVTTVRLEARLAAELYFSDVPARSRELAISARDAAHRLGDPLALSAATAVYHDAFVVGQADLEARLLGSERLLEWARETAAPAALLTAHRARVIDLLAAGDLTAVDAEIVAFRRIADPLRVPAYQWWPVLWSAMRALLEGRHDEAEALASEAWRVGEEPFSKLAVVNYAFLLFFVRREQGRLGELEAATREFSAESADIPASQIALVFLLAELGQLDEAIGRLSDVDDRTLERLHDRNWPATWFQLARVTMLAQDRERAVRLLEPRHRPSDRCITVSLATACLGATELGAAWLHHTVGDLDAADHSYRAAESFNARIGARSWLAEARVDHARALLDRDGPDDHAAAGALLESAEQTAADVGLVCVATAAAALRPRLAAVQSGHADRPAVITGRFQRTGDVWELQYGPGLARVPSARGLEDIAILLSRPGESVSAMELVATADAPKPSGVRGAPAFDERARREIRDRLRDLDAEVDDAETAGDGERAARAREARQVLAETVARDLGLGGRARRIDDPGERARKTVSTRIRRAIANVERAHPDLGRHLDRSIDTGAWCTYRPAETVTWLV